MTSSYNIKLIAGGGLSMDFVYNGQYGYYIDTQWGDKLEIRYPEGGQLNIKIYQLVGTNWRKWVDANISN